MYYRKFTNFPGKIMFICHREQGERSIHLQVK